MKLRASIWISIAIIIITFINTVRWHPQNGVVSLSGGMISDMPFHDETVYETTIRTPDSGITGIGLHLSYPRFAAGDDMTNESAAVTLKDITTDELILNDIFLLRNTGYSGDTVNEGVLLIPLEKRLTGDHLISICICGQNIDAYEKITVRIRHDSEWMDELLCNGEPVDGSLYAVAYTPKEAEVPLRPIFFGVMASAVLLLWGFLHDREKSHSSSQTKNSYPEDSRTKDSNQSKNHLTLNLRRIPARNWTQLLLILIAQIIALEFGYYAGIRRSLDERIEYNQKSVQKIRLEHGESIEFDLPAESRDLAGIAVDLNYGYQTDQVIEVSVKEKDSGTDATSSVVSTDMLLEDRKGSSQIIRFPNVIHDSRNKVYTVSLRYLSGGGELELTAAKPASEEAEPELYVSGVYRNRMFLQKLYLLISLVTILCTCLIWYCCIKKMDWLNWLPAVLIPVGLCFMLLIKPFSVPDEYIHFDEAYKISNNLLGIPQCEIPEGIYKRSCDVLTDLLSKEKMDGEAYRWERDTLRREIRDWPNQYNEDLQLVYARRSGSGTSEIFYMPAALGLTVGRLLGFGFMGVMYLARLFQFLTGVCLLVLAIRRIPVGKTALIALTFMPVMMMELVSVSYDAVIIPVCFACTAQAYRMLFSKEDCTIDDVFLLFFLSVLVGVNKAGAYVPIALLSLTAVYSYFARSSGDTSPDADQKVNYRRILAAFFVIAIAIAVISSFGKVYLGKLNVSQMVGYNSRTEAASYTLAYLLRHPGQALRIAEGTLYWRLSVPLGISGAGIGWVGGISLDIAVRMIGIIYLAFSCVRIEGEAVLGKRLRILSVLAFLISTAAFNYAMLTGWTVLGSTSISGVQGRYYIPILPLLMIALRSKSPVFADNECHSEDSIKAYRSKSERNFLVAGYIYSLIAMVSFAITALGS